MPAVGGWLSNNIELIDSEIGFWRLLAYFFCMVLLCRSSSLFLILLLALPKASFAVLPGGVDPRKLAVEHEAKARENAKVVLVLAITKSWQHKDKTLIHGGYPCLSGPVVSVDIREKVAGAQAAKLAPKVGDVLSVSPSCQIDGGELAPGELRSNACALVLKAKKLKIYSSEVSFPKPPYKNGCSYLDQGVEILK